MQRTSDSKDYKLDSGQRREQFRIFAAFNYKNVDEVLANLWEAQLYTLAKINALSSDVVQNENLIRQLQLSLFQLQQLSNVRSFMLFSSQHNSNGFTNNSNIVNAEVNEQVSQAGTSQGIMPSCSASTDNNNKVKGAESLQEVEDPIPLWLSRHTGVKNSTKKKLIKKKLTLEELNLDKFIAELKSKNKEAAEKIWEANRLLQQWSSGESFRAKGIHKSEIPDLVNLLALAMSCDSLLIARFIGTTKVMLDYFNNFNLATRIVSKKTFTDFITILLKFKEHQSLIELIEKLDNYFALSLCLSAVRSFRDATLNDRIIPIINGKMEAICAKLKCDMGPQLNSTERSRTGDDMDNNNNNNNNGENRLKRNRHF